MRLYFGSLLEEIQAVWSGHVYVCLDQQLPEEHRAGRRGGWSRQGGTVAVNTKPLPTDVLKSAGPAPAPVVLLLQPIDTDGGDFYLLMSVAQTLNAPSNNMQTAGSEKVEEKGCLLVWILRYIRPLIQ